MERPSASPSRDRLPLEGAWRFRLDPSGVGGWLSQFDEDASVINLPGSTDEAGKGYRAEARLGHLSREHEYVGPAWYRRDVVVPEEWSGRRLVLFLERPHWETQVWMDRQYVGRQDSLSAPHRHELGQLTAGSHELTIRVDNTVRIGVGDALARTGQYNLAHSVTDHTQTNWNGIVGQIELRVTDLVWIEDVQVYPDLEAEACRVVLTLGNATGKPASGHLSLEATSTNTNQQHACPPVTVLFDLAAEEGVVEAVYPMDGALPWDEFSPAIYSLTARLEASATAETYHDSQRVQFGLRTFEAVGRRFHLNGRPVFLRGTLECCVFPLTGYPPTDVTAWRRILDVAGAYGLNHVRFHSWCPPEAAFVAADELGVMLQVEGPLWAEFGSDPQVDAFARSEGDRILRTYGNHPSFCLMAVSNEPGGADSGSVLATIIDRWRDHDPRRLYTGGAGWPTIPQNDFHCTHLPRSYQWEEGLEARFNAEPLATDVDYEEVVSRYDVPLVSHEIGQWTSYPDYGQISRYTGVLKPHHLERFRRSLEANAMLEQADAFTSASGKLQVLLYKEEIEAALRTPEFGGFQLLGLSDYPGQGAALVGVLDAFWDSKGYVTPEDFRQFCGETVLLAGMPKVVWETGETFVAEVQVANFGAAPLEHVHVSWRLVHADGGHIASGGIDARELPFGSGLPLGKVSAPLEGVAAPSHLVFELAIEGTPYRNHWDLWLYPTHLDPGTEVHIAASLDTASLALLRQGGSVLLLPPAGTIGNDIPLGFTTPFWNTAWTEGQPPHTLGILCRPDHPALASFPTRSHSTWQWWEVLHEAKCLVLDGLPTAPEPIIRVIDDWTTNRNLALAVEAQVEGGKLLVCSADLRTRLEQRPVARQLLHSLASYMQSPGFVPEVTLDRAAVLELLARSGEVRRR